MNKQQLEAKTISFKKFSFHELGDLQGSIPREEEKTGIRIVSTTRLGAGGEKTEKCLLKYRANPLWVL